MAKNNNEIKEELDEQIDILDLLLDENNDQPIVLYDEDNNAVKFEQIAVIPDEDDVYAVLKPIDELEGVADDEAIVFLVDFDEDGNSMLVIEQNEETAIKIFDKYYQLLDEEEAKEKEESVKKSTKK